MAYLYNGQPVNIRVEFFRTDGVRYNNLLDAAIRTKVGIVENGDPDPFRNGYCWLCRCSCADFRGYESELAQGE